MTWITLAFLLAFFLTFAAVMPLQNAVAPSFGNYASLIFLPHGVRIVAAWLYGWRSIVLLTPGAMLSHSYLYGNSGFSVSYMIAVFFGVFCAALSFWIFARCGWDIRLHRSRHVRWRDVILAGVGASVLNSLGTTLFFGNDMQTAAARFFGDVTGMFAAFFLLMMMFRMARRSQDWFRRA